MRALITAGGRGTRLRPLTFTINKHLVPIANKPMLFYALEKITAAGISDIGIIINDGDTELPAAIGDGSRWGARITYIPQKGGALGLAHAVGSAREFIGDEPFLFYLGDNVVLADLGSLVERFMRDNLSAMLSFARVPDPHRFGVPQFEGEKLVRILEKPQNPPSDYAVTGIYIYNKDIFDAVNGISPSARGELEISDAHTWLLENQKPVGWQEITGWWKDTGKPEDLLECNRLLLELDKSNYRGEGAVVAPGAQLAGSVSLGAASRVGENVVLNGPVAIGDNVIIENAVIGPHVSLGNNVSVDGATISNTIVLDGVAIHTRAEIVDSLIGSNARIVAAQASQHGRHRLLIGDNSLVEL